MPTFSNLTFDIGASAATYTTASVTPTANRLILVTINCSQVGALPPRPTVTGNGITYELVRAQDIVPTTTTDRNTLLVFRGMSAAPTSGAITINFGAAIGRCTWVVDQSSADVDTSGSNGSAATVASNSTVSTATVTTQSAPFTPAMSAGNAGYCAVGLIGGQVQTPRAGWTELADRSFLVCSLETQYIAGADTDGSSTFVAPVWAAAIVVEVAAPPGPRNGTLNVTLPAAQAAATGTVPDTGTLDITLPAATGDAADVDMTVIIGPTRLRETVTVDPTRTNMAIGDTRDDLAIGDTRDRPLFTAGPTRTNLAIDDNRPGVGMDETRPGTDIDPTRIDRGA